MYRVISKMKIIFKSLLILILFTFSAFSEVIKEIKVSGNQRVSSEDKAISFDVHKLKKNVARMGSYTMAVVFSMAVWITL